MTPIERAAKAIADLPRMFCRFNDWTADHVHGLPIEIGIDSKRGEAKIIARYPGRSESDGAPHLAQHKAEAQARAVLQALREPSEAMIVQGAMQILERRAEPISAIEISGPTWQAMLTAALEEGPK